MKQAFNLKDFSRKYMMEILLVVMIVVLSLTVQGFVTPKNLLGIMRGASITGVIAFGMTMTIIGGEIDLSVGSTIALSAVLVPKVTGMLEEAGAMPRETGVIVGILVALLAGALIGLFNGYIRIRFEVPSFIITLAMLNSIYGISAVISNGFPVTSLPLWYSFFGAGQILGVIPWPAIWLLIVFAITLVIMDFTTFGREVYAVGGNLESARLSGINVKKVKIVISVVTQVLAAFAGIILSSQVMSGSSTFGRGYEMTVISSVIIGGASLNGGIGRITGTFLGIIFLGILLNGMTLLGIDEYRQYIIRGAIILGAVLLNTIQLQSAKKA